MKKKIVVFDFDKTLTYNDTLIGFFTIVNKNDFLFILRLIIYLFYMVLTKIKFISNDTLKSIGVSLFLKGRDIEGIRKKAREYSKKIHFNNLYKRYDFNNLNDKIIIISASFQDYLLPLFPKNVEVIGSKLKIDNGKVVSLKSNCYSEKKVDALKEIGITEIDVLYTDSLSDLPLANISSSITVVSGNNCEKCITIDEFKNCFK